MRTNHYLSLMASAFCLVASQPATAQEEAGVAPVPPTAVEEVDVERPAVPQTEATESVMVRDPFQPFNAAATPSTSSVVDEGVEARQTLASYPLDAFRLVGIMRSPDMSLAAVQTRDTKDYIIAIGDNIGKEGGVVEEIRKDGISVRIDDELENIAVSNKVEVLHDKKNK